jgi:hypothetical protein
VEILQVKPKCASSGINELFLAAYFLIINASFMPSVAADSVEIPDLKVKSAGVELSLPLDSCCAVSLCSLIHAERVQQMHPDLKMTKLTKPVAINVANEDAVLQGIALQDIPITRYSKSVNLLEFVKRIGFGFIQNHFHDC